MKQQVINYEYQILQNQHIRNTQPHPLHSHPYRFSTWKLSATLNLISDSSSRELKWIGNEPSSSIIAYFYAIFKICAGKQDVLISLKHSLYKVCQYCLNLSQQKSLVEFIGLLAQGQPLICRYLQRNSYIEELLVKIYEASISLVKLDVIDLDQLETFARLKHYSQHIFNFLSVQTLQNCENALEIKLDSFDCQIYILKEKQCYFVLESRHVKTKTQLKIRSLEHKAPAFEQCIIIDEEADEEETNMKESSRKTSKKQSIKNPSQTKSNPPTQSIRQSPAKHKSSRIPKFLYNHKRKPRASMNEESMRRSKPKPFQQKIALPIKQNYSNKILTNFPIKEKQHKKRVTKKSTQKSASKSYSKSSKQRMSGEKIKKTDVKTAQRQKGKEYPQKQKTKLKEYIPIKVNSQTLFSISPSLRYNQEQYETSLDKVQYLNRQKRPLNYHLISSNSHYSQENKIYPVEKGTGTQPHINYQKQTTQTNKRPRVPDRLSESPHHVVFNYDGNINVNR